MYLCVDGMYVCVCMYVCMYVCEYLSIESIDQHMQQPRRHQQTLRRSLQQHHKRRVRHATGVDQAVAAVGGESTPVPLEFAFFAADKVAAT